MTKHTTAFKLRIVKQYVPGLMGYKEVGRINNVGYGQVRRWVLFHRYHGKAGLEPRKSVQYSADEKLEVLRYMWAHKLSYLETAAKFNIRAQGCVGVWERDFREGGIVPLIRKPRGRPKRMADLPKEAVPISVQSDVTRSREELLVELNQLRMEVAVLKKRRALAQAAEQAAAMQKAHIVHELRLQFPVAQLLALTGLKRSTFYYQQKVAQVGDKHADLKACIETTYEAHKGRMGYRRIADVLRKAGQRACANTVQRCMQAMKLKSLVRIKKYKSYKGEVGKTAPNVLLRDFNAESLNQKWATDVTEMKVAGQKVYLSPVMDLYNGEIVAYEMDTRPVLGLVTGMLKKAFQKLGADDKPIMHSDQGWQYRMPAYQKMLEQKGIVQSMSRKGNCLDNAAMESFFAVLKTEYFHLNKFSSVEELKKGLAEYIDYYNHCRIKMKLNGLSPVQYRTQHSL
ncbi:IS3 family transposase [Massilia violaceinigra]|uniref:IS3 family transposase n=1 Tax=Massilia violaceinigra TaxID=2045208 RepID=UPI001FB4B21B|nr:IS3 family transposase [Massilia violaceinigra]